MALKPADCDSNNNSSGEKNSARVSDIVVVSQVFYPDPQATSQLLSEVLVGIAKKGVQVRVITGYTPRPDASFPSGEERFGGIQIKRTGIAADYRGKPFRRGCHYLCFLFGATFHLWRWRKCSLVVGVSNPPFTPVWIWLLSKCFVGCYHIILHDMYPDGLVGIGKMRERGLPTRLWRALNAHALRSATRVMVIGRDMGQLVESVYGVPRERIEFVPHWSPFDSSEPLPLEQTRMSKGINLKNSFVLQYSGNMGLWHDIDAIVEAASRLRKFKDIHFLMIGDGMRRARAERRAEELLLENMTWLPFQAKEDLIDSLSCCHLAIISLREGLKGVAVPCKLYGILASARGVLAMVPEGSEVDMVVHEEECGVTVVPGDIEGLVATILKLRSDRSLVERMASNAFKVYRRKYRLDSGIQRFFEVLLREPAA
jgi:glycosyltransferase involved in cell wall biosynthesis